VNYRSYNLTIFNQLNFIKIKKSILILATAIFLIGSTAVLTSCESERSENTEQHEHPGDDNAEAVYACPMHHNITGKEGDKCSICGMDLTSTETAKEHQGHSH